MGDVHFMCLGCRQSLVADESGAGLQRLSKDVARDLVTSILENF